MEIPIVLLLLLGAISVVGAGINLWRNRWQRYVDPDAGGWKPLDRDEIRWVG